MSVTRFLSLLHRCRNAVSFGAPVACSIRVPKRCCDFGYIMLWIRSQWCRRGDDFMEWCVALLRTRNLLGQGCRYELQAKLLEKFYKELSGGLLWGLLRGSLSLFTRRVLAAWNYASEPKP